MGQKQNIAGGYIIRFEIGIRNFLIVGIPSLMIDDVISITPWY